MAFAKTVVEHWLEQETAQEEYIQCPTVPWEDTVPLSYILPP